MINVKIFMHNQIKLLVTSMLCALWLLVPSPI